MHRTTTTTTIAGLVVAVSVLTVGVASATTTDGPPPGDLSIEVFARIGSPGQPDGLYVTEDRVFVGTHNAGAGDRDAPSVVFAHDHDGRLVEQFEVEGQDLAADHGLLAMARDADGVLYIADREPARIVALDPVTGEQSTYATFVDLPSCGAADEDEPCSAGATDMPDFTDAPVFAPDGTMYVTDLQQAVVWRVPPGGGAGEVWLTDARFESVFGVNGIQLREDGRTMVLSVTASTTSPDAISGVGHLYETVIGDDGLPGELTTLWESRPGDGPDGFSLAASGRIYVPLAGANALAVVSPDGEEVARVPATPVENQLQEVPFDTPVTAMFLGDDLLLANQSFFAGNPDSWAVFRVAAGEPGLPLFEPDLPGRDDSVVDDAGDDDPASADGAGDGTGGDAEREDGTPDERGLAATGGGAGAAAVALLGLATLGRRTLSSDGPAGPAGRRR